MENKILTYDSVEISFDGKAVVQDVNFSLAPGEILGLVGESGSGKSTLIKAAMGLLGAGGLVTRGDIRYLGQNILDIPEKEKRKIRGAKIQKVTRKEAKDRAMDLFEKLNFKDSARVWKSYPFELSGGMNQRAGIAIAMLMNPPILFADEPTSALDVSVQRQVVKEMLKLRELFGTAIVIVTHDIGVVRAMADTVLVLKDGKTVEYGTADVILDHPKDPYTKKLLAAVPKLQRKVKA